MPGDRTALALWVGAECTINRVGNRWRDQSALTGFSTRLDDLDRMASLGAKRVRLPVLWERAMAAKGDTPDFAWPDAALARLHELGVEPIVGLMHHGSGPRGTSLLDRRFPRLFADYARRVAERYPTLRCWTPINEPLTTARFSCLYGLWYPHRQDDRAFVRALLHQVQATVLAMQAIRAVNPLAELVQTDDLGFTRSTPALVEQATFDNERRWLAFDLLCGRVDPHHPLWDWLRGCGASLNELTRLRAEPCVPDIGGINAYVTSERFLDERLALHAPRLHGGNGRDRYVDIETVRAHGELIDGFAGRLREAHARYGLPLAITEVHMGCTREEQMRWLQQAWQAAEQARHEGIDVRGVTAWAAFGTVDWNSLLTEDAGHYEPGLWDVRGGAPRLTALGRLAASLGRGAHDASPERDAILAGPGWWQRDLRLSVAPHGPLTALPARGAPLLIVGRGTLGRAFARLCHMRGLPYELLARRDMDIARPEQVARVLETHRPWALINAAGYTDLDAAERDAAQWLANAEGPLVLARACGAARVRLLSFSSDQVFSGAHATPYLEHDPTGPRNAYGRAQAHAERGLQANAPEVLLVRSAALFGPWDDRSVVARGLAFLEREQPWLVPHDQIVSPTYVPDLVQAALDLLIDGERGLWHLTNGQPLSWADFACLTAEQAHLSTALVRRSSGPDAGQTAPRPSFSALGSLRSRLLPSLDDALVRYRHERERVRCDPPSLRSTAR